MQFVGDHISSFEPGNIVLVGPNLPHFWKYNHVCFDQQVTTQPYSTVIHFFKHFIGERFLALPEARPIKNLLDKAVRGILLKGENAEKIGYLIEHIYVSRGNGKNNCVDPLPHGICAMRPTGAALLAGV